MPTTPGCLRSRSSMPQKQPPARMATWVALAASPFVASLFEASVFIGGFPFFSSDAATPQPSVAIAWKLNNAAAHRTSPLRDDLQLRIRAPVFGRWADRACGAPEPIPEPSQAR